jgi:hypothetical protein
MLISLQFPITDLRWLLGLGDRRVKKPLWPYASPEGEFVRGHGPIKYRNRGGLDSWSGEDIFAGTKSGIKLEFGSPRCVFRRFFYDGNWNARYEFGFISTIFSDIGSSETHSNSTSQIWTKPIRSILESSVRIRKNASEIQFHEIGKCAIDFFLESTTINKFKVEKSSSWAFANDPILVAELQTEMEGEMFPSSFRTFECEDSSITLIHFWTFIKNRRVKTWVVLNPNFENSFAREIRLNLMRLHSEKECLKRLLWGMRSGLIRIDKHTEQSDVVQRFLAKTISKLYGQTKRYQDQVSVRAYQIAHDCDRIIDEGGIQNFYSAIEAFDFRPNIAKQISAVLEIDQKGTQGIFGIGEFSNYFYNIENLTMSKIEFQIGDGNVFQGPFVVAEKIKNSFNNAQSGTENVELRDLLKNLVESVAKLQEKLETTDAEASAADVETFVNEAIRDKPRRSWLTMIGENLKNFASKVEEFAGPVAKVIEKIIAMIPT